MGKAKLVSWVLLSNRWKLSKLRDRFSPWKCISWSGENKRLHMKHSVWEISQYTDDPESCPWFSMNMPKVLHPNEVFSLMTEWFSPSSDQSCLPCSDFPRIVLSNILNRITTEVWGFFLQFQMQLFQFVVDILSIRLCGSLAKISSISL